MNDQVESEVVSGVDERAGEAIHASGDIVTSAEEGTLLARFEEYLNDNEAAFAELGDHEIALVKYSYFAGASACYEMIEATQPESPNAASIITSANQVTTLRAEMVDYLEGEEDA